MKLSIKGFAVSMGIMFGLILFINTWWLMVRGMESGSIVFLSKIYPFYTISPLGSLLGLVYGFGDGLLGGALFAWLYNLLAGNNGQS